MRKSKIRLKTPCNNKYSCKNFTKLPNAEINKIDSFNILCMSAKIYALSAYNLWSNNKYELAKERAITAFDMYKRLDSVKYQYPLNEREFITLAIDIIERCQYFHIKLQNRSRKLN